MATEATYAEQQTAEMKRRLTLIEEGRAGTWGESGTIEEMNNFLVRWFFSHVDCVPPEWTPDTTVVNLLDKVVEITRNDERSRMAQKAVGVLKGLLGDKAADELVCTLAGAAGFRIE